MLYTLVTGEVPEFTLCMWLNVNYLSCSLTCLPLLLQFPVPAEPDHCLMLKKVKDFPNVLPETFSSALGSLLTEVSTFPPLLSVQQNTTWLCFFICWCSFYARIQWTAFAIWSVLRCRPSSVALPSTRTSSRRHRLNLSSSSGLILIGLPNPAEALHWTTLITLTVIRFFAHPRLLLNSLRL